MSKMDQGSMKPLTKELKDAMRRILDTNVSDKAKVFLLKKLLYGWKYEKSQ